MGGSGGEREREGREATPEKGSATEKERAMRCVNKLGQLFAKRSQISWFYKVINNGVKTATYMVGVWVTVGTIEA